MLIKFVLFLAAVLATLPAAAQKIGVIEIGSKGIKGRVVDVRDAVTVGVTANEVNYEVVFRREINVKVREGVVDRQLQPEKIVEAANAVTELMRQMRKSDPVSLKIVGSTSFDNIVNRGALEDAIERASGQRPAFITSDEEIYYALVTSVRRQLRPNAILIDIGSGNTKIGYASQYHPPRNFASVLFEYGTATLYAKAKATGGSDIRRVATDLVNREVRPLIRKAISDLPGLANSARRVYIEGGTPWGYATYAQPKNSLNNFTYLTRSEIDQVQASLGKDFSRGSLTLEQISAVTAVGDVFTADELAVGGILLTAILDEMKVGSRRIVFNRNGGWALGYAISKYRQENALEQ